MGGPRKSTRGAVAAASRGFRAGRPSHRGSAARSPADVHSDIDLIIVAESSRPEGERFKAYLSAIVASPVGIDLHRPEDFERLRDEERSFLMYALEDAKLIREG